MNMTESCFPRNSFPWLTDCMMQSAGVGLNNDAATALQTPSGCANPFFVAERLSQINLLLQRNYYMINDLQKRINCLVDLNERIAREFDASQMPIPERLPVLLQKRPPEETIIEKLFRKCDYKYNLIVKGVFKPLLYKDRNFNLFVSLVDNDRKVVTNNNSISLKITAYTSTSDPTMIETNNQNEPIFKGNVTADLSQGFACFQRLSFREVSSKFDRGLVHFVVAVDAPPFDQSSIDHTEIRPLVIRDVMIRAKKQT